MAVIEIAAFLRSGENTAQTIVGGNWALVSTDTASYAQTAPSLYTLSVYFPIPDIGGGTVTKMEFVAITRAVNETQDRLLVNTDSGIDYVLPATADWAERIVLLYESDWTYVLNDNVDFIPAGATSRPSSATTRPSTSVDPCRSPTSSSASQRLATAGL